MRSEIPHRLRTAAWYGDSPLDLEFPENWDVAWAWPDTPPPLEDSQIRECLARPTGQAPIRERCRGKRRPVVLVDDMNRPTPVARVMPFLLEEFRAAGIAAKDVTMIMARGSHGASPRETMLEKIGLEAAVACRFLLHNPSRNTKRIGKTSQGTPVLINRDVLSGDFVMGIGGVYPNHTTGFGGGTKLALGVLDLRVISHLHHHHDGAGWGSAAVENGFRRDVDDMARMIGLETFITMHVDANRELVRMRTGDFRAYFGEEVRFARKAFRAPWPESADVVISNAYPNDLSLTFAQAKGDHPLRHCAEGASRILLAACSEGEGWQGVFPVVRVPRGHGRMDHLRRLSLKSPVELAGKVFSRLGRMRKAKTTDRAAASPVQPSAAPEAKPRPKPTNPIWLYLTGKAWAGMPRAFRDVQVVENWKEILAEVEREQGTGRRLKVLVYPCGPLQCLDPDWKPTYRPAVEAMAGSREEECGNH